MKKEFSKKLTLHKTTVVDLNAEQLSQVRGGAYTMTDCTVDHTCNERCDYAYSMNTTPC